MDEGKERRPVIPRSAITVVIENERLPLTYGVVANISEAGVCVWTNGRFTVGESLVLRLSFAREPQPYQAEGVIVWGDAFRSGNGLRHPLRAPVGPRRRRRLESTCAA